MSAALRSAALTDDFFEGHVSLERGADWVKPWRIPYRQASLFPPRALNTTAYRCSGVRLRFATDASIVELGFKATNGEFAFDAVIDGDIVASTVSPEGAEAVRFELPVGAGERVVEIYLPQAAALRITSLSADGALRPALDEGRPRWITYGSSITECRAADGPASTWPAIVARRRRLHLTNLGFSGNCHLEPMVARMIRDLPGDVFSFCLGINVFDAPTLNPRTFQAAVIGFVSIVREKHPTEPIVVLSPIHSPDREDKANPAGITLKDLRLEVEAGVQALKDLGDANLYYVNGLDILGPDAEDLLPDQLHPNAEGYRLMARNFDERVMEFLMERYPQLRREAAGR